MASEDVRSNGKTRNWSFIPPALEEVKMASCVRYKDARICNYSFEHLITDSETLKYTPTWLPALHATMMCDRGRKDCSVMAANDGSTARMEREYRGPTTVWQSGQAATSIGPASLVRHRTTSRLISLLTSLLSRRRTIPMCLTLFHLWNQPSTMSRKLEAPVPVPHPVVPPQDAPVQVTYTILQGASNFGKDVLLDSMGYRYARKVNNKRVTVTWRCYKRSQNFTCKATVMEKNGEFIRGSQHHICTAESGREKVLQIRREVKDRAGKRVFDSAAEIVEEVLVERTTPGELPALPTLPRPVNLAQQANRKRQKTRPQDHKDLDFDLDPQKLDDPAFLQRDIRTGTARHILLATPTMLGLLAKARTWYMDGTFRVVRKPFYQLFSIHSFVRSGTSMKQVPLAFVLMSTRRAVDYKDVLRAILDVLPSPPAVVQFVRDFEAAAWQAIRSVFPAAEVQGCLFHFTQAVYRKLQELGLQVAYNGGDPGTYSICRSLMALPLLPQPMFETLIRDIDPQCLALLDLAEYVRDTWIEGPVFTPRDSSVYRQPIRTNNDVEGWHNRLNNRGKKANLPFFLLCQLLHKEARLVTMTTELVQREDIIRAQRHGASRTTQGLVRLCVRRTRSTGN